MPRSLILHIGTMKTGSTTIQTLLTYNRAALRDRGICYAAAGGINNHMLLALTFCSRPQIQNGANGSWWGGRDPAVGRRETCEAFSREMAELPPEVNRVIVSSELLSQYVTDPEDLTRLHSLVAPFFDDIEVLIYLRRQDGHLASYYTQSLRRGVLARPSVNKWKDKQEGGVIYDYDKLLSPWAEMFGEAAIKPRIYERDTDKTWDVVADFIEATGVGPLPPPPRALTPRNPSINAAGQAALREIGWLLKGENTTQAFARDPLWRRVTAEMTAALPGRGWQPTQDEARDFVARFAASNERVRARWLPGRKRLFSNDYSHLAEHHPKPEPDADLHAVSTTLISALRRAMAREDAHKKRSRRSLAVKRALRLNKDDPLARLELARLLMEDGEWDTARKSVQHVLKLEPDNEAALALQAEIEAQAAAEVEAASSEMV